MIDRRSFIIGSGAVLTASYVEKAAWFLRNKNAVPPISAKKEVSNKLFFVDQGIGKYEIRLGGVSDNFPTLTYREALKSYFCIDIPKSGETSLSEFRDIYDLYGIRPNRLDAIADPMFYVDLWGQSESPHAKAYYYLHELDLTGENKGPGPLLGDLDFRMGEVTCADYLGVLSEDPITASLLQARLIELGHNTSVEIVDAT
jgi:hypothetical protein